jgi:neutral ceramidase
MSVMNKKSFNCRPSCHVLFLVILASTQSLNAGSDKKEHDQQEKTFKAGAAKSNITPFLGGGIIGGWGSPEATHVHDELHARCLVLDDGTTRLVFIVADVLGLRRDLIDEAKSRINKTTNIPVENIMISVTHTHSATSAMGVGDQRRQWNVDRVFDEYQNFLLNRLSDVVRTALNNMEPAQIGWGVGSVPQHVFVRRWKMKPGTPIPNPFGGQDKVVMNPGVANPNLLEPAGKPDPDVSFISVRALDERPISVLANYSLHYVGGVPQGHISADYFAIFADKLQELLQADRQNPPFIGIMSNGTSGDVNNINFRGPSEKYLPYEKMRIVADDVAKEVYRVYNTIKHQDWVPLRAAREDLTLNVRKPDQEMITRAQYVLNRPETVTPVHRHENVYAERTLYLTEWPDQVDIVLQVFGIGDLGVAAIPFETFSETGLEIKAKSPFKSTFTIELANGYYGYLPTPEQHELGGYETWMGTCNVEKQASVKIVAKLLNLFGRIKGIGSH